MNIEKTDYAAIGAIQSVASGYRQGIILQTGIQLNVFHALSEKELTAIQIAKIIGTESRATELFLNALVSLGYLDKREGKYKNAPDAEKYLVLGRPHYIGDMLRHDYHLIQRWINLPEVVRTGEPVPRDGGGRSKEELRDFIMAMENLGRQSAEQVLEVLDLSGTKKLLDVGGGPGTHAILYCRRYPGMKAVVFDLPDVVEIAEEEIRKSHMTGRVSTHAGDYLEDSLGTGFDAALISNIIHSLGEDEIVQLFSKAYSALLPNGKIIVKDFIIEEDMTSPRFSAIFAINMLIGTERGRCYTRNETERWLAQAGFGNLEYCAVTEQTRLVIGYKM